MAELLTESDVVQKRQQAHAYLDRLPKDQLSAVSNLLESMLTPLERALALAPIDDEPLTDAERKAIDEASEWLKHNQPIPLEEVLAEFGLTSADWEKMADEPEEMPQS